MLLRLKNNTCRKGKKVSHEFDQNPEGIKLVKYQKLWEMVEKGLLIVSKKLKNVNFYIFVR